jgi:hypothetical protein
MRTKIESTEARDAQSPVREDLNTSNTIDLPSTLPVDHQGRLKMLTAVLVVLGIVILAISGRLAVLAATRTAKSGAGQPASASAMPLGLDDASPRRTKFPALRLEGITYRGDKSTAVINGKTFQLGDYLQDVTVVGISPSTVTVSMNGRVKVLTLAK